MKKIIAIFILCLITISSFANERIVPASALPANATAFLNTHFSGVPILYVEEDWGEFEVSLNNGVEIVFIKSGEWDKVDARYQAVPTSIIPQVILNTIQSMYEGVYVISIEKDWAGFEIELSNRIELKMDKNGKVFEIDYDD